MKRIKHFLYQCHDGDYDKHYHDCLNSLDDYSISIPTETVYPFLKGKTKDEKTIAIFSLLIMFNSFLNGNKKVDNDDQAIFLSDLADFYLQIANDWTVDFYLAFNFGFSNLGIGNPRSIYLEFVNKDNVKAVISSVLKIFIDYLQRREDKEDYLETPEECGIIMNKISNTVCQIHLMGRN